MKEISIKKHIVYLFGVAILMFVFNKLYIRPLMLENDSPEVLLIFSYSIPNLIEAVVGTIIVTGILLQTRQYFNKKLGTVKDVFIHLLAVVLVSIYVLTQELKLHNLGGNNVYDPYDLIASMTGLLGTFIVIRLFGFVNKKQQ